MTSLSQRGVWWVIGQGLLMILALGASMLWRDQWHSSVSFGFGIVLFAAGGLLGVSGVVHLGRNRTALPRPLAESTLVQTGVYGMVRHPLYASVTLASLGWAMIWSSVPGLALAILLGGYLDAKARHEERWLRARYPAYEGYARRVSRFIPGVY